MWKLTTLCFLFFFFFLSSFFFLFLLSSSSSSSSSSCCCSSSFISRQTKTLQSPRQRRWCSSILCSSCSRGWGADRRTSMIWMHPRDLGCSRAILTKERGLGGSRHLLASRTTRPTRSRVTTEGTLQLSLACLRT